QVGRLELDPALRERVLDALVLADRAVEDDALVSVACGALERHAAQADRLGGDQDALRVHAVQDVIEAAALFAQPVLDRDAQVVDKELVRVDRLAPHLRDLAHLDGLAVEVAIKMDQYLERRPALYVRSSA